MEDEIIGQFCAVTSAEPSVAERYLAFTAGDLDTAVTLFFESGGQMGQEPSVSTLVDDRLSAAASSSGSVTNAEDDEAMARRLAQEWGGQEVRAPIAPTRQVLQDDMTTFDPFGVPPQFAQHFGSSLNGVQRNGRPQARGVFNQAAPSVWDQEDEEQVLMETTGGASAQSSKSSRLAKLFQPPFDIMSIVDLDSAKSEARAAQKWIMVNLQDNADFASQVLNRDLWKDKTVKSVVAESFVFLQYTKDSDDGLQYIQFYPFEKYPHISILDPRTGERVKTWSEPIQAMEFISDVTEFLERYSLDNEKQNPVHKKLRQAPKSIDQMSEEDQLNAAIMASVGGKVVADESEEEEEEIPAPVPVKEESPFDRIPATTSEEPGAGPDTTRIQLRLPASRTVRRFLLTDTIQRIFEHVKGGIPEAKDKTFKIVFNRSNLIDRLDTTIQDAGLKNASLVIEFQED